MPNDKEALITIRDLKRMGILISPPALLSAEEIRAIRIANNSSQGTFATKLGVSLSAVQKWESGGNSPTGIALRLLHVVKKHSLAVLE